jgi:hypothetical protein
MFDATDDPLMATNIVVCVTPLATSPLLMIAPEPSPFKFGHIDCTHIL